MRQWHCGLVLIASSTMALALATSTIPPPRPAGMLENAQRRVAATLATSATVQFRNMFLSPTGAVCGEFAVKCGPYCTQKYQRFIYTAARLVTDGMDQIIIQLRWPDYCSPHLLDARQKGNSYLQAN